MDYNPDGNVLSHADVSRREEKMDSNNLDSTLDVDSDDSDESRLSLSFYVDMEKSVIIQSDISEHYRTDKIQYLERSNSDSVLDSSEEANTSQDTQATYKYNANTQKDLNHSLGIVNTQQQQQSQQYSARFKTETKTIMLEKPDKSGSGTMRTSKSANEVMCASGVRTEVHPETVEHQQDKPKQSSGTHTKKQEEPPKPRTRLGKASLEYSEYSVSLFTLLWPFDSNIALQR